jgi:hypothetical protein
LDNVTLFFSITLGLHHQSSGTLTKGDTTVVFHTETQIGGKVDFYHHSSDNNKQQKENKNMEISNMESKKDETEIQKSSTDKFVIKIAALILTGLLMVNLVERPWLLCQ